MSASKSLFSAVCSVAQWYQRHGQALPWRSKPGQKRDIYSVWVSEIMLQQTTVVTVEPYYERFMRRFPTVQALADSDIQEVLAFWAGLGYYRRAHHLHRCAQVIAHDCGGVWPTTVVELQRLPGIGHYTAGALCAISLQKPAVALDTNVQRVLGRMLGIPQEERLKTLRNLLQDMAWGDVPPGDFYQGAMDIGRIWCGMRHADCGRCPMRAGCQGRDAPIEPRKEKPTKPIKEACFFVYKQKGRYFLRCGAPEGRMLAGLWIFPSTPWVAPEEFRALCAQWNGEVREQLAAPVVRHVFSHFVLNAHIAFVYDAQYFSEDEGQWFDAATQEQPLSSLARKLWRAQQHLEHKEEFQSSPYSPKRTRS